MLSSYWQGCLQWSLNYSSGLILVAPGHGDLGPCVEVSVTFPGCWRAKRMQYILQPCLGSGPLCIWEGQTSLRAICNYLVGKQEVSSMIHPTRSTGSPFVGMQFTNNLIQATWHRAVSTEQEIWIPVLPLFSHVTTCQSFCLVGILEILPDFIFITVLYSCCNHLSPPTFANGKTGSEDLRASNCQS